MTVSLVHFHSLLFLLGVAVSISEVSSCTSNTDCPLDQCCGKPVPDLIGVFQTCQPYSQEGGACHGSLLSASCDCLPGLVCVEHTGLFALFHTSKGVCRQEGEATNTGFTLPIFGK